MGDRNTGKSNVWHPDEGCEKWELAKQTASEGQGFQTGSGPPGPSLLNERLGQHSRGEALQLQTAHSQLEGKDITIPVVHLCPFPTVCPLWVTTTHNVFQVLQSNTTGLV